MAGALGVEQALHHGDGLRRGHADRLVERHPAMDIAAVALLLLLLVPPRIVVCAARLAARIGKNIFALVARLPRAPPVPPSHGHCSSPSPGARSLCTAGVRSNFSIRSASSNRSSARNRISGANFRLTRCAISPRRYFLLRSSADSTISVSRPPSGMT